MAKFKDKEGNEWQLKFTVLNVGRMREADGLSTNVLITDPESLAQLLDNPGLQFEVAWVLVQQQADAKKIDAEKFSELFTDAYAEAGAALRQALEDFFRSIGKAEFIEIVESTSNALGRLQSLQVEKIRSPKAQKVIESHLQRTGQEIDAEFDRLIAIAEAPLQTSTPSTETAGLKSGELPASSA